MVEYTGALLLGRWKAQFGIYYSMRGIWDLYETEFDWMRQNAGHMKSYSQTFWIKDYNNSRIELEQAAQEYANQYNQEIDLGKMKLARAELIHEGEFIYVHVMSTEKGQRLVAAHNGGYLYHILDDKIDMEHTRKLMEYLLESHETNWIHSVFSKQTDPLFKDLSHRYMLNKLAGNYDR